MEIIAFVFGRHITARLSPGKIILIACIAGTLRWGIFGLSAELGPTLVVQFLQGATLGLAQTGVAAYMRRNIAPEFLASASSIYHAAAGLTAALAILMGAYLYPLGSSFVFFFTASLCALATIAATLMVYRDNRSDEAGAAPS